MTIPANPPAKTAYDILGDQRIGVSAPTAADTGGLVDGPELQHAFATADKIWHKWQASEQQLAAAREQIAALEREVKRLQSDVREAFDHDGRD